MAVLWGDAQEKQLVVIRALYDKTLPQCALGDWELGFEARVLQEDGLSALLEMCGAGGRHLPALPLHVRSLPLLSCVQPQTWCQQAHRPLCMAAARRGSTNESAGL